MERYIFNGNLGADAQMKEASDGRKFMSCVVYVNTQNSAKVIECTYNDSKGEYKVHPFLKKGIGVLCEAFSVRPASYTNKNGELVNTLQASVSSIEIISTPLKTISKE